MINIKESETRMSGSSLRTKRHRKLLEAHPDCYFCGGSNPATTIDHVPPRACFPDGYAPEGFEFPACQACNQGAVKQDQIFGHYSMLLDFDESKLSREEDMKKIAKLWRGITNNYPEALPDEAAVYPVNRVGHIITPKPVAISLATTPALKNAIEIMMAKLIHALYFRETSKILTQEHKFFSYIYQPQRCGTQDLTAYLNSLMTNLTVGARSNIKNYGDRFRYISEYKDQGDFFCYAAQFGHGIVLLGIACGPEIERPSGGALSSARWLSAANGSGAATQRPVA